MTKDPILVIGATGKTGSRIADRLEAAGQPVRRAARRGSTPFDWEAPETWQPALTGARAAYISYFPDLALPGAVDKVGALAEAARGAGVSRLVLLSGRGEQHAQQAEAVVRAVGVETVLVRSAWFAQNFSEGALRAPVLAGAIAMPGGDVREPIVDVDDIADVATAALIEPHHAGELYEVTGPRLLSFADMALVLSQATGRPVRHVPIDFETFHAGMADMAGPMIADVLTAVARETLDGRNAHVCDGVQRALGRPPRDFTDFADTAARAGAWSAAA